MDSSSVSEAYLVHKALAVSESSVGCDGSPNVYLVPNRSLSGLEAFRRTKPSQHASKQQGKRRFKPL